MSRAQARTDYLSQLMRDAGYGSALDDMYIQNVYRESDFTKKGVTSPTSDKVKNSIMDLDSLKKAIGSGLGSGIENVTSSKIIDTVLGSPGEQAKDYMDTMFPNTDAYERLGAGSAGAASMSSAERVARVNANSAKKVASINQNSGNIAKAQANKLNADVSLVKEQLNTQRQITARERQNAKDQALLNRKQMAPSIQNVPAWLGIGAGQRMNSSQQRGYSMPPLPNKY